MFRNRLYCLGKIRTFALAPWRQRPIPDFQSNIGHHKTCVKKQLLSEPVTIGTGTKRRIERKQPRLNLGNGKAASRTSKILTKGDPFG